MIEEGDSFRESGSPTDKRENDYDILAQDKDINGLRIADAKTNEEQVEKFMNNIHKSIHKSS